MITILIRRAQDFEMDYVDGRNAWFLPSLEQLIINVADFRGGGGMAKLVEGAAFIQKAVVQDNGQRGAHASAAARRNRFASR